MSLSVSVILFVAAAIAAGFEFARTRSLLALAVGLIAVGLIGL